MWLTDGIDHASESSDFAGGLAALAKGGTFAVLASAPGHEALGLNAEVATDGKLGARVIRSSGPAREGAVHAFSAKGERLGEAPFKLAAGATAADMVFDLPLELRNQVTRVEIAGEGSAGAVSLLDQRSQWQRVGLISGESQEQAQPLLAPLYYISKAVQPYAEVIKPKDANLAAGIDTVFKSNATVLILAFETDDPIHTPLTRADWGDRLTRSGATHVVWRDPSESLPDADDLTTALTQR